MSLGHLPNWKNRLTAQHNAAVPVRRSRHGAWLAKRAQKEGTKHFPFIPPEKWYEPQDESTDHYRIVSQPPGQGYRHVVVAAEIRQRLDVFPAGLLEPLQVVQLSTMTRKKQSFPCYGMQWGNAVYLYPVEEGLVEYFDQPPRPALLNETRMFGGRWVQESGRTWKLIWTDETIKDFYLNNVLIHEIGHLLDNRNSRFLDRERFAEWFAIEHGYKPSRRAELAKRAAQKITRRHHAKSR